MKVCSIILSAGKGSRMFSETPKPLHLISGKPMLEWVIDVNKSANIKKCIIVIPEKCKAFAEISNNFETIVQKIPKGTGDAVKKASILLKKFTGVILVCFGDTPFLTSETLKKMIKQFNNKTKLVITGFKKFEKNNYGKIIFSTKNEPIEIIEQKDAEKRKIYSEFCNGGVMAIHSSVLNKLNKIEENLISGEFYLTDLVKILNQEKQKITFIEINEEEILGINNQVDLSVAEKISQNYLRRNAMLKGVKLIDPETVFINHDTKFGRDVVIHPNVVFGQNVIIDSLVQIKSFSHLEECKIKSGSSIGPFARIRGDSILGNNSKVGNFVEIKKSKLSEKVKINHLSYVGDSEIGSSTNIGAGTITCNYDGKNKNKTKIGKNSFVGSNSTIIAPIKIGENVTMGAGSTFNKDIPNNTLAIGRAYQINKKKKS
ncbi:MAG: bifunctional UDP-N-acetylglucosamine diphosphorylase/glucosamine-1-phosphate N-acetyltransferase GlmU [Candidatus Puniceispirillales bacterium]